MVSQRVRLRDGGGRGRATHCAVQRLREPHALRDARLRDQDPVVYQAAAQVDGESALLHAARGAVRQGGPDRELAGGRHAAREAQPGHARVVHWLTADDSCGGRRVPQGGGDA